VQLLGTYNNNLASFQYEQLLAILQAAIAAGDLSSGSSFDKSTLQQLEAQATSFSSLPQATAGTRALDESILQPLQLLQARFTALLNEANNFVTRSEALISFLEAETDMLNRLLAADGLQNWVAELPQLPAGWSTSWDFSIDQGKISQTIAPVDPSNGVSYPAPLNIGSILSIDNGDSAIVESGLLPPATSTIVSVKNLNWTYPAIGEVSPLYGPDMSWADLTLVESLPQVDFTAQPQIQVILPLNSSADNLISVFGTVPGGAIPTYLQLLFYPRTSQITGVASDQVPVNLSAYTIDPDNISAYSVNEDGSYGVFYTPGTDFTVDQTGSITPIDIGENINLVVRFSENFPAYQCSVDQINWSDIHMLDASRPYRDDETVFYPLSIKNGLFPLTDETGLPSGLYFSVNGTLNTDYTLLISTPGASSYGPNCQLEIDLQQPTYCNTLVIKPFSEFPAKLVNIELQGLAASTRSTIFSGAVLIDQPLQIRFTRQLVSSIFLTFVQENYTITEFQDLSTNSLRQSTMATVEASLPFSLGQYVPPVNKTQRGYQYDLGYEEIQALDVEGVVPGIFVQGPMTIEGCPIIFRLDYQNDNQVEVYLCYQAFSATGVILDQNLSGFLINPGTAVVVPYTAGTVLTNIASFQVSLKFILRNTASVLSRYNLQAVLQ
jgi:hypothetical protein